VLSIFPLTAPLTMPSRIASGGGSPIEVVIALALALLTLAGVIWLAARIYSGGILQSSKVGLLTAFRGARDIR
jgi:ABC-2 type transport system permease protein